MLKSTTTSSRECQELAKPYCVGVAPRGSLQLWNGSTRLVPKFLWEQVCEKLVLKEKLVENLLDACELMIDDFRTMRLKIAGSGEADYPALLREKLRRLGLQGRVEFVGEATGEA